MNEDDDFLLSFGHPLLRETFRSIMDRSPQLREKAQQLRDRGFMLRVAGLDELEDFNRARPAKHRVRPSAENAAASVYSDEGDGSVKSAMIALDLDKLHDLTRQGRGAPVDSAAAKILLQDAMLHELAHVLPIGLTGQSASALRDPKRGEKYERSPVGQKENEYRASLGLPARTTYGLLD